MVLVGLLILIGRGVCDAQHITWTRLYGPSVGSEFITNTHTDRLFAVARGHLYISDDDGKRWHEIPAPLADIVTIASPGNERIFVSTAQAAYWSVVTHVKDYHRTETVNWQRIQIGNHGNRIYQFVSPAEGILLAASIEGIYRSDDYGDSWSVVLPRESELPMRVHMGTDGLVAAQADALIYFSGDAGISWSREPIRGDWHYPELLAFGLERMLMWDRGTRELFVSYDQGMTWEYAVTVDPTTFSPHAHVARDGTAYIMDARRYDSRLLLLPKSGDLDIRHFDRTYRRLHQTPEGTVILMGLHDNVRFDGQEWIDSSEALASSAIRAIAVDAAGVIYAGDSFGDLSRSTDNGASWQSVKLFGMVRHLAIAPNNDVYVSATPRPLSAQALYRRNDVNGSWQDLGIPGVRHVGFAGAGIVLAATDVGLLISFDNGERWSSVPQLEGTPARYVEIRNKDILVASDRGIFESADGGASWRRHSLEQEPVVRIASMADVLYAVLIRHDRFHMVRSYDDGSTWQDVRSFEANPDLHIGQDRTIYAAVGGDHLYYSTDDGDTWRVTGDNVPPHTYLHKLAVDRHGHLLAGTLRRGVFRTSTPVQAEHVEPTLPGRSPPSLHLFPNPASDYVNIQILILVSARATLEAFDLLGRQIETITDMPLSAGHHTVTWRPSRIAPGVYLVRLQTGEHVVHRTIVISN